MNGSTRTIWFFGLLALVLTGQAGCQTGQKTGSTSHASVQILGRSRAEIERTMTAVFREQKYALAGTTRDGLIFERPGTSWESTKWGGWSEGVIIRVKVKLSVNLDVGHLLEADAYAVDKSDNAFFRTESRNPLPSRKPYQQLLDEVARRLK